MTKAKFDTLFTDREPFEYIEKSVICIHDGILVSISKDGVLSIPSSNVSLLYLGPGTSITQEAVIRCAENMMNIGFVRGKVNVHSYFLSGRWPDPQKTIKQVLLLNNKFEKLRVAKILLKNLYYKRFQSLPNIDSINSIEQILGFEAQLFKREYKNISESNNVIWKKREVSSIGGFNGHFSILNKLLYTFATSIILNSGLNPSIGIIHGSTRRGALAFDLADQFKLELCTETVLENSQKDSRFLIAEFNKKLKSGKNKIAKDMFKFCDWLVSGAKEEDWPL